MPPKGKKAAPAPFPQGKASGSKKPAKVRFYILTFFSYCGKSF